MSYTRDPDHYTRGIGAVQAVDKVLSQRRNRGRARMLGDAALESMRRDRLRARLLRPALGMVNNLGTKPLDTGGNNSTSTATPTISGGGGSAPPRPPRQTAYSVSSGITPMPTPPSTFQPLSCGPGQSGSYPNCVTIQTTTGTGTGTTSGSSSGGPGVTTTVITPDGGPVVVPTSQVGSPSGGPGSSDPGGGVSVTYPPDDGVDTDTAVMVPTGPDYKTYALYAGGALALFLLYRSMRKGK